MKKYWGTFVCSCGTNVSVTIDTVQCGNEVHNLFEAECSNCGKKASSHYPEQVLRELRGENDDTEWEV